MGGSSSARVKGYHARRPMRAVLLAVILSITAGLVWFSVLHQTEHGCPSRGVENRASLENPSRNVANQSADPAATAAATSSQRLPANGLDTVPPAPPQFTRVQVLNANGVRGEATVVDGMLAQLGFAPTTTPANDPQYPAFDLHCYGEIRFGAAGQAAARTLSLAVPCAELVRDVRPDATVDLALGTKFTALRPDDAARTALTKMTQSVPVVNPDLLRQARQVKC
jgi:LytR cell envelope-related transcriptional attenuator